MKLPRFMHFSSPLGILPWIGAGVLIVGLVVMKWRWGWWTVFIMGQIWLVWPMYILFNAISLHSELHHRGYHWMRFSDTYRLVNGLYHRPWKLPHRDEAATIPGYTDTIEGLHMVLLPNPESSIKQQGSTPDE